MALHFTAVLTRDFYPEDLKPEELTNYLALVELKKSSPLSAEQNGALQTLQSKG